jgi:hypothetical protein
MEEKQKVPMFVSKNEAIGNLYSFSNNIEDDISD